MGSRRRQRIRLELAAQVGDRVGEMAERDGLDACERRLCSGFRRAEHALDAHASCAFGDREDAADAAEAAVERELAHGCMTVELVVRQLTRCSEDCERDG